MSNGRVDFTEDADAGYRTAYAYDPIGNRIAATNNGAATAYAANELNQYTNIAPTPGALAYDLDGNMVSDGTWTYAWDAENRLVGVAPAATNAGAVRLDCGYDFMGRRVRKAVETWVGSAWSNTLAVSYTYDGWNLVCEDRSDDNKNNYYVWGLDLSGSLQGAGGVGGLLARVRRENIPRPLYYACDANGNVTDVLDKNGAITAHYEYDGFGNTITQSGSQAETNPFRFSTKYSDDETGLVFYGYRFYSPELGRWINRDPLGDVVFLHAQMKERSRRERSRLREESKGPLYNFVSNDPSSSYDKLGLAACFFDPTKAGCVKIEGCTEEQLSRMCLIPEDWVEGDPLNPPSNGWNCPADGLWVEGNSQWFGVPNHCQATITCTASGATASCCCNAAATLACKCYNKLFDPSPPKKCGCGFFDDAGDTEHPTSYGDCFPEAPL